MSTGAAALLRMIPWSGATCQHSDQVLCTMRQGLSKDWSMDELASTLMTIAHRVSASREPDFQVRRADGADRIYLRRWWLVPRGNDVNVYLHQMILDDDAVLHDHPYRSMSLMLTGGLTERYQEVPGNFGGPVLTRRVNRGDIVARSERLAHQLLVDEDARGRVWTIFVTGPRLREWGFWCPHGWRKWSDYVAVNQDPSVRHGGGTSGVGIGCGEIHDSVQEHS